MNFKLVYTGLYSINFSAVDYLSLGGLRNVYLKAAFFKADYVN